LIDSAWVCLGPYIFRAAENNKRMSVFIFLCFQGVGCGILFFRARDTRSRCRRRRGAFEALVSPRKLMRSRGFSSTSSLCRLYAGSIGVRVHISFVRQCTPVVRELRRCIVQVILFTYSLCAWSRARRQHCLRRSTHDERGRSGFKRVAC